MKQYALAPIAFAAILCLSCATVGPIEGIKDVTAVDWRLQSGTDPTTRKVINPASLQDGRTYFIDVIYTRKNLQGTTMWRSLYDYSGLTATIDNPLFQLEMPKLTVRQDPFLALRSNQATLSIEFPPSIGKTVSKTLIVPLDQDLPSFQGWSGQNGTPGLYGTDGKDGANLDLHIARYSGETPDGGVGASMVLVHDAISGRSWIIDPIHETITVNAAGGNGGNGGDGENRTLDKNGPGDSIKGQDGGAGGRGGRGGDVFVTVAQGSDLADRLKINVAGGFGGKGGKGGKGEMSEDPSVLGAILIILEGTDGEDGKKGSDGLAGRVAVKTAPLDQMFLTVNNPLFKRERLLP